MNALSPQRGDDAWTPEDDEPLPPRPRRQWLTERSAALLALLTAAAGFYAGVRVQKGQTASSASAGGATGAGFRARALAAAGGPGGPGGAAAGGATSATGGGLRALFGGTGGVGGTTTVGSIASISGRTLYVAGPSGNVVRVQLTTATKVTKSLGVSRAALRPGDTVIVRGITGAAGRVTAASVSDSGVAASPSTSSSSTGASSGSSSSGSSAVGSLFSPGG